MPHWALLYGAPFVSKIETLSMRSYRCSKSIDLCRNQSMMTALTVFRCLKRMAHHRSAASSATSLTAGKPNRSENENSAGAGATATIAKRRCGFAEPRLL